MQLQSVKGDSTGVDGCALIEYEIGKEKQEHELFIVPQMNRNTILGRGWCTHVLRPRAYQGWQILYKT